MSPSTASAEQHISGAGLVDGERRGRLHPRTLEQLVVAHGRLTQLSNEGNFDFNAFAARMYDFIKETDADL